MKLIDLELLDCADFVVTKNENVYYVELGAALETVRLDDLKLMAEALTALVASEERL